MVHLGEPNRGKLLNIIFEGGVMFLIQQDVFSKSTIPFE
jgi:hypothetical protein